MTATIFRQASDITTRQQVWVSSVPSADPTLEGQGHSAAQWGGTWAYLYRDEATNCPVSVWKQGSTLEDPDALHDLMRS